MLTVRQVALDTSRGSVLELAHKFYACGRENGVSVQAISVITGLSDEKTRALLRFLRQIGFAEILQSGVFVHSIKWRMTEKVVTLYEEIFGEAQESVDE